MGNGPFGVPICPGGLRLPHYPALLCTIPTAASPLRGLVLHLPRRGTSLSPSAGFIFFPLNSLPLLSPCFSHPDVQCHQARSGVWAPTGGAAGTFWVAPSAHPSSSHHGCAWYHHRGGRVVPGGVPAPPAGASRQSRGGGTGHGAHTLPAAEQEEPFMERERGEGTGRGGRKLKAEPKQKGWREGRELGKNGAQQGSRGAAGMKSGGHGCGHPHHTNEDCGAVPGL